VEAAEVAEEAEEEGAAEARQIPPTRLLRPRKLHRWDPGLSRRQACCLPNLPFHLFLLWSRS